MKYRVLRMIRASLRMRALMSRHGLDVRPRSHAVSHADAQRPVPQVGDRPLTCCFTGRGGGI